MSEEEKKAVIFLKHFLEDDDVFEISNKDLRIILNLIEKQQKELNSLKEIEQSHKEENGKLRVELEQEKEKNKELEKHYKHEQEYINGEVFSAKQMHLIDEDYISKDKIREIVNECLEKKKDVITDKEEYCFNVNDNSFLAHRIVELLEEE